MNDTFKTVAKWTGLVGSILLGASMIIKGDATTGIGIITAAFSAGVPRAS